MGLVPGWGGLVGMAGRRHHRRLVGRRLGLGPWLGLGRSRVLELRLSRRVCACRLSWRWLPRRWFRWRLPWRWASLVAEGAVSVGPGGTCGTSPQYLGGSNNPGAAAPLSRQGSRQLRPAGWPPHHHRHRPAERLRPDFDGDPLQGAGADEDRAVLV